MANILYIFGSVLIVSLISLIGIFSFSIKSKKLEKILLFFVSFSVGALFGDAFIHLLPEAFKNSQSNFLVGVYVISGILFSFIIEKFIHWRHCHVPTSQHHMHPLAYMNLVGDSVHNFIDGLVIAVSFFVSIPVGTATTLAIILHEIPQEMGDFGVLIYAGFTKKKALLFNFLTALVAVLGAFVGVLLGGVQTALSFLIPFAAGNFIYIAGSDLIPELHKELDAKRSAIQFFSIVLGIAVMIALLLIG